MFGTRKGLFFTFDGILAAALLLFVILLLPQFFTNEIPLNPSVYAATDTVNVLANLHVYEVDNPYIQSLISSGVIANPNQSVLEQIGEFWANNDAVNASNLSRAVLLPLLGSNFEVLVNGESIYGNTSGASQVASGRRMVSGIAKALPKLGYSARAFALHTRKNNTFILAGDVITSSVKKIPSGNNGNEVNSTYTFTIPANATITDAYWFIEAYYTDNKFKAYLNGNLIPGSDATGDKLLTDVESYLHTGVNTATVISRYGAGGAEAGEDGASHVVVSYTTDTPTTLENLDKKYFAVVNSNTSIRYKKPVFALGGVSAMNVELNMRGSNATLGLVLNGVQYNVSRKNPVANHVSWSSSEIASAIAANITYANLSGQYFWLVLDIDTYQPQQNVGTNRAILNNSYVQITTDQSPAIYGKLDLTSIIPVTTYTTAQSGSFYRNLTWNYTVGTGAEPLMLDSQLAWLYSTGTNPSQTASSNGYVLYAHPPQNLVSEFARFAFTKDKGHIVNGTNKYKLNFTSGYGVNPFNSLVFSTQLIDVTVPYGSVFTTEAAARADAVTRLKDQLGQFINATEVGTDTSSLGNVPSLWGPAMVEVRTWK